MKFLMNAIYYLIHAILVSRDYERHDESFVNEENETKEGEMRSHKGRR